MEGLNEEQRQALTLVKNGYSIFLTGPAGVGKSFTIAKIIEMARENGKRVCVTATTGVAACLLNNVTKGVTTFHSWASIGIGKYPVSNHVKFILRNEAALSRIRKTHLLIVDEVSMLDGEFLTKVDEVVRAIRGQLNKPFGGIQVVFTGDFGQLPPVQPDKDRKYLFEYPIWNELIHRTVVLTQVYRQKDVEFVELLLRIRDGSITDKDVKKIQLTEFNDITRDGIEPTTLYCKNRDVNRMNQMKLNALSTKPYQFTAKDVFKDESSRKEFEKSFNLPEKLVLKVGAQVMLLINDCIEDGLSNGSRGVVEGFYLKLHPETHINKEGEQHCYEHDTVIVRFLNGITRGYSMHKSEIQNEKGVVVATRVQFPFRLAWCYTIHLSQGQTIDLLDVDLSGAFEVAQAYVAISRGTSLSNMRVRNFSRKSVMVNEKVVNFYNSRKRKYITEGGGGEGEEDVASKIKR